MNMESRQIRVGRRLIGTGQAVYVVAELSANHHQKYEQAQALVRAAKEAGADAVKLQTYRPDTITIDCDNEYFRVGQGSLWQGRKLYDLYQEAYTPWEWQPKLKELADGLGLDLFSTPFDSTAVDFLEEMQVPAYKIASFEIVDLGLVECVARTGRPIIMSTGMATWAEIEEAVGVAREASGRQIALLKCCSAYPARAAAMNLRSIPHLAESFGVPVGLSDHSMEMAIPVAAVALGACIVEKHFTLSREVPGPDSAFSLEPHEFKAMVQAIRTAEEGLGGVHYGTGVAEATSRDRRRSLFVVQDTEANEVFTEQNVRSIRPGNGLAPKFLKDVLGKKAARRISRGTPLSWSLVRP